MNKIEWISIGEDKYQLDKNGASATLSWDILHQDWYLQIVEHDADYVDESWRPLEYELYESSLEGTLEQKDKVLSEAIAIIKDVLHV